MNRRSQSCLALSFLIAVFLGPLRASVSGAAAVLSSAPSRVAVAPRTLRSDEVTLIWQKPDDTPIATYQVRQDGRTIGSTDKPYFTVRDLSAEHDYVFSVQAEIRGTKTSAVVGRVTVHTPAAEPSVSVTAFGAKGDGRTDNTRAIQQCIEACPRNGVVEIPAGVFVSGALFLKSDMTLQIDAGGVLQGSTDPRAYEPFVFNRFEGWEMKTYASLLNAGRLDHSGPPNVRNLSIRGRGRIAGGGEALGKAMIAAHGLRSRGRLICLMNCSGVEIQGLTLETPPCWTLHYIYSENVSIHDLTIDTSVRNGDGLDPDSSTNSFIFNCTFSTGDDCIAIKSGKNPEGNLINRPTENVRIVDCRFTRGHGISIGSEMSGGVRNVVVEDCVAGNLLHGLQIKATKDRGGFVEDVVVRDCSLQKISILTALDYNNDGTPAPEPPRFRHFRFRDLDLSSAAPGTAVVLVNGFAAAGHRTSDVSFENVKLPAGAIVKVDQAEDVVFANVLTIDGKPPVFDITRSERGSH